MPIQVLMPHMGESVVEGRILRWLKRPGEIVTRDEVIAEVETDKADVEIPAPQNGVLSEVLAQEGASVPVGKPIAVLDDHPAGSVPASSQPQAAVPAPPLAPETRPVTAAPPEAPRAPRAGTGDGNGTRTAERDRDPDRRFTITPVVAKVMAGLLVVTPLDARRATETLTGGAMATGDLGARWWPQFAHSDLFALVMFLVLAATLYRLAKRKLDAV